MLQFLKAKKRSVLGIDINASTLAILEVSKIEGQFHVEGYGYEGLPSYAVNDPNTIDLIANRIKTLIVKNQLCTKQAVIALPDSLVAKRLIQAKASLSASELVQFIASELSRYHSFPVEELNFDFEVLGNSSQQAEMLDVLVVASRTEQVNYYLEILARAGLETKIVDVRSYAVERMVQYVTRHSEQLPGHPEHSRHVEHSETSPQYQEIPRCARDDVGPVQDDVGPVQDEVETFQDDVKLSMFNPFVFMSNGHQVKHEDIPALSLACGLALRFLEYI